MTLHKKSAIMVQLFYYDDIIDFMSSWIGGEGRLLTGKIEADKGRGVISDPVIHERIVHELRIFVEQEPGVTWKQLTESPLRGPAGNKEFLVLLEKTK